MAIGDMFGMMKQFQGLQEKAKALQEEVQAIRADGRSGGGLVRVTVDGRGALLAVAIDPSLFREDSVTILEDLIIAAANDARDKAETAARGVMARMTEGLPLPPGMTLPF